MGKPLQLSRLPKASRIRTVNFRRTTPGALSRLIAPHSEKTEPFQVIDESHPWSSRHPRTYASKLPGYQNVFMKVRAFPKALLGQPERPYPDALPSARDTPYGKDGRLGGSRRTINMSLMFIMSKKDLHKSAVVRNRIKSRIKSAIGLVVTRGATAEEAEGTEKLVQSDNDNGEKWILQDWTYVFIPSIEVYSLPLTALVSGIQDALLNINSKCRTLESVWNLEALRRPNAQSKLSDLNDVSKTGRTSRGRSSQSLDALARVKALLKPYASLDSIPDEDLLGDEGDEVDVPAKPSPTSKGEPNALRMRRRHSGDSAGLEEDNPAGVDQRRHARRVDIDREANITQESDNSPSAIQRIFSRRPILKPVIPEKRQRQRKE